MKSITVACSLLPLVAGEIGLIVQTNTNTVNQKPIRLVDGYLTVGGNGPLFQGVYDSGSLVLSDRVVAEDAAGSGIGIADDGLLIVTFNVTSKFYDRDGWLDYDDRAVFGLKQVGQEFQVYVNRPDLEDATPALIEIAALEYPRGDKFI